MSKITLMLICKNEEHRYLKEMLDSAAKYCDNFVIMDDNSTDNTYDICKSYKQTELIQKNDTDAFVDNESSPREKLFRMTMETNPEWIVALDADEILENKANTELRKLLDNTTFYKWYSIQFHHFWHSRTHYRVDKLWVPAWGPRIFKIDKSLEYNWRKTKLHCGSIPVEVLRQPGTQSGFRVKHLGYAGTIEETKKKYDFYISKDPEGKLCPKSHYDSMLDPNPVLKEWIE